jgi:hypothetical protein
MRDLATRVLLLVTFLCVFSIHSVTQQEPANPYAPDQAEAGSVEAIERYTTEARFSNPWVAYVPASATVTSPTKYLGHVAGAAGELSNTTKVYGYMRELDRTSNRVHVQTTGAAKKDATSSSSPSRTKRDSAIWIDSKQPLPRLPIRAKSVRRKQNASSKPPVRFTTSTPACTQPKQEAQRW